MKAAFYLIFGLVFLSNDNLHAETLYVPASSSTGVTSATVLESGITYSIAVSGTFSAWSMGTWNSYAYPCGEILWTNEGWTAHDPEFWFGEPNGASPRCPSYPMQSDRIHFNLGSGFVDYDPIGGLPEVPAVNHYYLYEVEGMGSAIAFKILDDPNAYGDNYGGFVVTINSPVSTESTVWGHVKGIYR